VRGVRRRGRLGEAAVTLRIPVTLANIKNVAFE
jgi:hypothetical protein